MSDTAASAASREVLETLNTAAGTGGRKPTGATGRLLFTIAICWSLFQLWYASPLPYLLNFGVFNDGQARVVHLCFAFLLAFTSFSARKNSLRDRVSLIDWALACLGIVTAAYLLFYYRELSQRAGLPIAADVIVSAIGVVLLLEAARRAVGPALAGIAALMLAYIFSGPWLPGLLAHKGASLSRAASQMWLTSEGIFGVALGVSTSMVFLFVLFGSLLERAGAGHYFIQLAYSLLGQFRGGPAKAGVVASGMTGMISGSSIANTVTTGTFTIPLMKKVGYTPVKAGAIECAAGVNGQLMPPVMGAAAFLIAEYVGISYAEVVKHAFIPALLTYGSLFYIVDIEAAKMGMRGLPKSQRASVVQGLAPGLMLVSGIIVLSGLVYWGIGWIKDVFGAAAGWIIGVLIIATYLGLLANKARHADLLSDDAVQSASKVPDFFVTARTGLHHLLPVIVLIWCLMVEDMSPGLSAFWGTGFLIAVILTQRPLVALFRGQSGLPAELLASWNDLLGALEGGARNMTGVGIATATAGIIVGTVGLTGVGLVMTEIVESVSGGNLLAMLAMTAAICLLLGMGMPTTASYVVVATLMAPVLVELAAQNDLAIPLVAVHLFVFYFGLMADVTPPVGLAAYAAAAIAGADPVKTGVQAFHYEIRTGLLPFVFIFNTELLLIEVTSTWKLLVVVAMSAVGMCSFVAATQNWLIIRNRWYETVLLLLICFTLLRPGFWLDLVQAPFEAQPASGLPTVVEALPQGSTLRFRAISQTRAGKEVDKVVRLSLRDGATASERLHAAGLTLSSIGDKTMVQAVRFGSSAAKYGLAAGDEIAAVLVPADRISRYWLGLPALVLFGLVLLLQRHRKHSSAAMAEPQYGGASMS